VIEVDLSAMACVMLNFCHKLVAAGRGQARRT
jgi:hypothetical protein